MPLYVILLLAFYAVARTKHVATISASLKMGHRTLVTPASRPVPTLMAPTAAPKARHAAAASASATPSAFPKRHLSATPPEDYYVVPWARHAVRTGAWTANRIPARLARRFVALAMGAAAVQPIRPVPPACVLPGLRNWGVRVLTGAC